MTSTYGCPHCGRSNPIDARSCAYCGTIFENVESSLAAQHEDDEHPLHVDDAAGDASPAASDTPSADTPSASDTPSATTPKEDAADLPPPQPVLAPPPLDIPEKSDADLAMEEEMAVWLERFPPVTPQPVAALDDDLRRQLRQMFAAEVPLTDVPSPPGPFDGVGLLRRTWIYWLLTAMLVGALLFGDEAIDALPHPWPGIVPVYDAIEALPAGATVLVDWAYDPATSGEMDLVARPVIEHLLARNANLVVISQLPLGPATARRLLATAGGVGTTVTARQLDTVLVEGGFLPGGAATLALLGQSPGVGLPLDLQGRNAEIRPSLADLATDGPVLSLVVSARSEPVQRWLEQVQPLDGVPVIAVTSAAAGPVLRPYTDSGQLIGLVSGYNGGIGYRELLLRALPRAEQAQLWRQINGHNWALVALLIVLVAANVALSFERRTNDAL